MRRARGRAGAVDPDPIAVVERTGADRRTEIAGEQAGCHGWIDARSNIRRSFVLVASCSVKGVSR